MGEINITLHNADQRSFPGAISIYPNPFKDALTIEFDRTEKSTGKIELLDIRGRKMWSEDYSARKGMNKMTIRTSDLPEGMYLLRQTEAGRVVSVEKIVK